MLLNRLIPHSDESLRSYILRLAIANRAPSMGVFTKFLGFRQRNQHVKNLVFPETKSIDFSVLSQNCDFELTDLTFDKYLVLPFHHEEYLLNYGFRNSNIRVCPLCIKESKYLKKIWDINIYTVCHVHGCLMIEECEKCNRKLDPFYLPLFTCRCGYNYESAVAEYLNNSYEKKVHTLILFEKLNNIHSTECGPINNLDLFSYIYLIMRMSHCTSSFFFNDRIWYSKLDVCKINLIIEKTVDVFRDWPNEYMKYLNDIESIPKENKQFDGLYKAFGNFYLSLYNYLDKPQFSDLHKEFEQYLLLNWKSGMLGKANTKRISNTTNSFLVSGTEAAILLKTHIGNVVNLLTGGELEGEIVGRKQLKSVLIQRSSIELYKKERSKWIFMEEVMELLDISKVIIKRLVIDGLIDSKKDVSVKKNRILLKRDCVVNILGIFQKYSHKIDKQSPTLISLKETIQILVSFGCNLVDLISALHRKEITPYYKEERPKLSDYYFEKKQIEDSIPSLCNQQISMKYASFILDENYYSVINWVKEGFIKTFETTKHKDRITIHLDSLDEFKKCYITIKEIMKYTTTNGVYPIAGPLVNGKMGYLFKRIEFEEVMSKGLFSGDKVISRRDI